MDKLSALFLACAGNSISSTNVVKEALPCMLFNDSKNNYRTQSNPSKTHP